MTTTARPDRLAASLADHGIDALATFHLPNVRWLTGFTGSTPLCAAALVGTQGATFVTDFRYVTQADEQVDARWARQIAPEPVAGMAQALAGAGAARVGFEARHLTVEQHGRLVEAVGSAVELVPVVDVVETLRMRKDDDELAAMRRAVGVADAAFAEVVGRGLIGRTEREVAVDLENTMRRLGAEGASYVPIVASGAHGALPHAGPRDVAIAAGTLVVIDTGARLDGYCSDCTRTYAAGPVSDRAREIYGLVLRAQEAALAAIRPGASTLAVDAVARDLIAAAGHGEHYGHGLGHGVGLEMNEGPRLNPRTDVPLQAGMVVTCEPGVYVPGELGVRIEDLVLVTDDGAEPLTSLPKSLQVVD